MKSDYDLLRGYFMMWGYLLIKSATISGLDGLKNFC